jgi:hypothetical protein
MTGAGKRPKAIIEHTISALQYLGFIVFLLFVYPWVRLFGKTKDIWVIGGHGGRAYGDNSAALHRFITRNGLQEIVWITHCPDVFALLRQKQLPVLKKNSLRARLAILSAPVLIRSHGKGDLDDWLLCAVRPKGLLIHLNHCMNLLKAGQLLFPGVEKLSPKTRKKRERKLMRFDYLLACSDKERENFVRSMPHLKDKIILGGGAHLDLLTEKKRTPEKTILYFPTWREANVLGAETVDDQIRKITESPLLLSWLETHELSANFG